MGVFLVVQEHFEFVAVVAVEAGHGPEPHKSVGVFVQAGDMIV